MADVFLSYAREDRERAEQVAQGLQAAGVEVFWDNEIPPGTTWADYIEQKLTQCKALIVLWSEHSTKSQWVREEARMGRDKGVLIPAMIDGAQAPFGFGEVQAANLAAWTGASEDPNWRRFVTAVVNATQAAPRPAPQPMSALPRDAAPGAQAWSAPPAAPATEKKSMPGWAWAAIAVVATIAVLAVAGSMMQNRPTESAAAPQVSQVEQQPVQQSQQPQMDPASRQVLMQQLQQAEQIAAQQGFQMVGQPFADGLVQGQNWNVPAQLVAGYDYRVIGVCDQNCRDMDIAVFDESGATIAQDNAQDDHPVVAVAPAATGNVTIQAQMFQCTGQPCYYALVLYGRQR